MIEALSQGLAGHGRKDAPKNWGGNVFLQVLDPEFFAGRDAFTEQMDYLSDRCRNNKPIDPKRPVRGLVGTFGQHREDRHTAQPKQEACSAEAKKWPFKTAQNENCSIQAVLRDKTR